MSLIMIDMISILRRGSLVLLLICSPVAADILLCETEAMVGFDLSESYVQESFAPTKFAMEIDPKKQQLKSTELLMTDKYKRHCSFYSSAIFCHNMYGIALTINPETLKFHYTSAGFRDERAAWDWDIYASHGNCEYF